MNSVRILSNPRHRIRPGLQTCANIQLEHDGGLRILGQDFHRALAVHRSELPMVIVISGFQPRCLQLIGGSIQRIGHRLPTVQARLRIRGSHDHILAAQNQIHVARFADFLRAQVRSVVVRREASDAEIVQELSHLLGLSFGPFEIGRIEFNALISHLCNGAHRSLGISFQFFADRVEFQAGGNRFRRANRKRPRQYC